MSKKDDVILGSIGMTNDDADAITDARERGDCAMWDSPHVSYESPLKEEGTTVVSYSSDRTDIQHELHRLLSGGERTWVGVYEIMDRVASEKLFLPDCKSFSAWVREEGRREGVSESLLWHRKSAGDFYREWAKGKDAPALADGERLSEENLNIVRKIAKIDPERGDELMDAMVQHGLSTKELRREWRELRDGDAPMKVTASSGSLAYTCGSRAAFDAVAAALKAAGIEFEPS